MAQLCQSDESSGSGLRPEQTIKPIFTPQPTAQTVTEKAQTPSQPQATATPQPVAPSQPVTTPRPVEEKPRNNPLKNLKPATPKRNKLDISALSINETTPTAEKEEKTEEKTRNFQPDEQGKLTDTNLIQCWQQFASSLQQDEVAMAGRLGAITPQLVSETSFSVTAGSDILEQALKKKKKDIEAFFSKYLALANVDMQIVVQKVQVTQKAQSKPEQLRRMKSHNHALEELIQGLELELE